MTGLPNKLFTTLGILVVLFSYSFYYYALATHRLAIAGKFLQWQESFHFFLGWLGGGGGCLDFCILGFLGVAFF
jgi:hypothetical protein